MYEYVPDVDAALAELNRVLAQDGCAVICDADWDGVVWRSPNPERMDRVLAAFDDHCPHPRLGSRLAPKLRAADRRGETFFSYTQYLYRVSPAE